ncbi:SDR family oxidoreductase [Arcobacter lacus]|nr:SDR family oxidoreductase [Arcobacter lacus]MCT7908197.1 SDR family oxidoreductase [Arcobacter lacus]MCT7912020.1 SDR family oxidoreductase [Arcobacter lacus]
MNNVENKKVLIIGGTSGFGLESCKTLLSKGANVIITGRDKDKLENVVKELKTISKNIEGKVLDASKEENIKSFFEEIENFDYMISMAGGFMGGGFLDASYETIKNRLMKNFLQI